MSAPNCSRDNHNLYHVLIEFAVRHLDFQMAELESVLDMHGIVLCKETKVGPQSPADIRHVCRKVPLPRSQISAPSTEGSVASSSRRPFCILSLPFDSPWVPSSARGSGDCSKEDIATVILSRCTLVRSVIELWGASITLEECASATIRWAKPSNATSAVVGPIVYKNNSNASQSWKLTIHTLGSKYTREEQDDMRALFNGLQIPGPIQMIDPSNEFVLIREVELDAAGGAMYPRHAQGLDGNRTIVPEHDARPPLACYFGRALGGSRSVRRMGGKMPEYDLKRRKYLGPTSMDAELSFIMTNLAQVRAGHVAFDPFVGTGSILLSCALQGAYCVGTDIDIRVLRGRRTTDDENVVANFQQFKLPRPELVRSDNSIYHRHFRCRHAMYDAIVCDPPYGIRAGARKCGSKRDIIVEVKPENRHDHIAQTQSYPVSDVMADLVDMAARTLVLGARLVYVIPSFADDFDPESDLPQHPCLELLHVCYQPLSAELGRRFVVNRKKTEYDPSRRRDYLSTVWKNGSESAEKCANIRDRLIEAAKAKPRYEERAAIRKTKRRMHKEEKKAKKRTLLNQPVSIGEGET
jgi:tRNA (guanine10-N2)-methyltransferase